MQYGKTKLGYGIPMGSLMVGLLGLLPGCFGASDASIQKNEQGTAVITWDGAGARLCVTEPSATCPPGKEDKVTGGKAYWVIDATCFNSGSGFSPPVVYGVVPECAKDVTVEHGGAPGGLPLEQGKTYKVTVAGFGGDPTTAELRWE